jgi:16S rRNA (cytidine1402-2'-O)-methyltransferase
MKNGILYLIPSVLAENTAHQVITTQTKNSILNCQFFLVENVRTARRYISSLKLGLNIEDLKFEILDKKTSEGKLEQLMTPIKQGLNIGVISEAGCPGIADPGASAVAFAHRKGIKVMPISGPSSMFIALMGSGFNGQSFSFHGYLPIDKKNKIEAIKKLEAESIKENRTQIFMETPFRNDGLLEDLKQNLRPDTFLCIAKNLTGSDEFIQTKTVAEWRKIKIDLHKVPTVFLIYRGG